METCNGNVDTVGALIVIPFRIIAENGGKRAENGGFCCKKGC